MEYERKVIPSSVHVSFIIDTGTRYKFISVMYEQVYNAYTYITKPI